MYMPFARVVVLYSSVLNVCMHVLGHADVKKASHAHRRYMNPSLNLQNGFQPLKPQVDMFANLLCRQADAS